MTAVPCTLCLVLTITPCTLYHVATADWDDYRTDTEMTEEEIIKKRIIELGKKAYSKGVYTCSHFLNMNEQSIFKYALSDIGNVPYKLFGGAEFCERCMLMFGSEELCGYSEEFPITGLIIKPINSKFSDDLTHRDFLGALMNLGIERDTIGDIIVGQNEAFLFCETGVSAFIISELVRVKHTTVCCKVSMEVPESMQPRYETIRVAAASERLDVLVAAVYKLSRSSSAELFTGRKVFVNAALNENVSAVAKPGDIISVRGYGRFIYKGIAYQTKKGKFQVEIEIPERKL